MKFLKRFLSFCIAVSCFLVCFIVKSPQKYASANELNVKSVEFYNTAKTILTDFVRFDNRYPGSEDETAAAEFIAEYLRNNTNCLPLTNDFITDGVQSFTFDSKFDGVQYKSQNIIYTHKSNLETTKKVILGCSYDAIAYKYGTYQTTNELVSTEGVNGSAGSVALLLAMAKYFSQQSFDFDLEFVFFGAGESDNAGSNFYTQGISSDDAKNIALMINLDKVSIGKNVYFYVDEIDNDFSKFFENLSKTDNLGIKKVSTSNLGKTLLYSQNKLGLDYSHIALTSNNINFMASKILTMNCFAGDYSSGISLGLRESGENEILTYTDYDSLEKISEVYGENAIYDNLFTTYNSISALLNNSQFLSVCQSATGQTNWIYSFFGNEKLISYLTISIILVFVVIILCINFKLTKKSYYSNIELEFVKTVVSITGNIDSQSTSQDVPDVVSDILVNDIKKDKRLKRKK